MLALLWPLLLLLALLLPTLCLPSSLLDADAAAVEDEATAACEDVVAQSSVDFSAQKKKGENRETNKQILIARQHKFAHSARHASPFGMAQTTERSAEEAQS